MYRQGDILFKKVDDATSTSVKYYGGSIHSRREKKTHDIIVAEGEATGHHHRIKTGNRTRIVRYGSTEYLIVTKKGAEVVHEEHNPLALDEGTYEIVRQREYAPTERTQDRSWAYVAD